MSEFLAEATVLIRPDTTRFRGLLEAELAAATRTPITIPVTPVAAPTTARGATRAATNEAIIEQQRLGIQLERTAASTRDLARAQEAGAVAATRLAAAQGQVVGAASAVGAAQVTLTRSTAAVAAAETAHAAALRAANATYVIAATSALQLARAQEQEAISALSAARAQATHASSLGAVGKAAGASGAAMLGLRGAVLTAGAGFLAATVAFQAFGRAVSSAIDFERELSTFRVTAGATADEMQRVAATARELGRDITLPGVAAGDAAETLSLLARAGLEVDDALQAARGTLQLATAAQIENAQAAELVANAINAFRLGGEEATRVADLLAGAANESQGSILDMGIALRQVAPVAALVNFSLEDTITILTVLARSGLSASDAGTSFRQAILRLIQDMPKVQKEVDSLGLSLRDVQGNLRPQVFSELQRVLQNLTPAARETAIANLGGADAIRTYGLLARAGRAEIEATGEAITRQGLAAEVAGARTEGLGGDLEAAKNEASELGLTLGRVVAGPLGAFVRGVTLATGALNDFIAEAEKTGVFEEFGDRIGRFGSTFAELNLRFRQGAARSAETSESFETFGNITETVTGKIQELADALKQAGSAAAAQAPRDEGLGVGQVLNVVEGFDAQEVRARIRGDSTEILDVLESERTFLENQLEREFVRRRPALRRKLEQALLGVTTDIASIQREGAAEIKRGADEAARTTREADEALLATLSDRRQRAENAAALAEQTAGVQDDIRAQQTIRAILLRQIKIIGEQIKDEQTRRQVILQLRSAVIATQGAIKQLRETRAQERAQRIEQIQDLNIQIAQERGNDAALSRAVQARINTINKQIAAARGDQLRVKQLILERERLRNQLKDLGEKTKEVGNDFARFIFEERQVQAGFVSNLLGNLIPRDQTAGLVGVPSPTAAPVTVGAGISAAAGAERGRQGTAPTAGQQSVVIGLLSGILQGVKQLNRSDDSPEAIYQRRVGSSAMSGGGGTLETM